jgi:hypothetical protein
MKIQHDKYINNSTTFILVDVRSSACHFLRTTISCVCYTFDECSVYRAGQLYESIYEKVHIDISLAFLHFLPTTIFAKTIDDSRSALRIADSLFTRLRKKQAILSIVKFCAIFIL